MRRVSLAAAISLAVMIAASACADAVSTPTTTPPAATPTGSGTTTAEPSPTLEPTQEPSPSIDPETLDDVGGVTTLHLANMPAVVLDLEQVSSRAEVEEHRAVVDYADAGDAARLGYAAYFVEVEEGNYVPVFDTEDDNYVKALRDSVEQLEGEGRIVHQSEIRHGEISWDCAETESDEGFERDMAVCRSVKYGRIISVSLVTLADPEEPSRTRTVEKYLGEISDALVAIGAG